MDIHLRPKEFNVGSNPISSTKQRININVKKILTFITLLMLVATMSSCSKKATNTLPYTNEVVPAYFVDMRWKLMSSVKDTGSFPYTGDSTYAIVNYDWMFQFYETWRDELFKQDVVKWDDKFDCNKFASSYIARAQIEYYKQTWKTGKPQALAMAEIWYVERETPTTKYNHAIVAALTNKGLVFFEPQTGKQIFLTEKQQASIYLKKF